MRLEAILSKIDVTRILDELCPLHVRVGQDGDVLFSDPRQVEIVAKQAIRATVTAEIRWPVLGIRTPLFVRSAVVTVRPEVLKATTGDSLLFHVHFVEVESEHLPSSAHRSLVENLNRALAAHETRLCWDFTRALSHVFDLPESLASVRAVDLRPSLAEVRILEETVALALRLHATFVPRAAGPRPESGGSSPPAPEEPEHGRSAALVVSQLVKRSSRTDMALYGAAVALAGVGAYAVAAAARRPTKLRSLLLRELASL